MPDPMMQMPGMDQAGGGEAETQAEDTQEGGQEEGEQMPTLTLNSLQLPQVVDWEDGQEYTLSMKVKQSGKTVDKDLTQADFQIVSVTAK